MKTNFILVYFNCTKLALLLAMVALSLAGCKRDELHFPETSGETVAINLDFPGMTLTRAGNGRAIDDQTIEHVRVFAFERNVGGRCRLNHFVKQLPAPFWFELSAGSYDFHFVINEPLGAGGIQNTTLDAVKTLADLHAFNVPTANLIDADGRYMMCGSQNGVKVEANYLRPTDQTHPGTYHYHAMVSYTDANGANHTRVETLNIEAFRLATKVNLRLVNKDDLNVTLPYTDFADVKITNLPAYVPVIAGVNSPQPAVSEITLGRATIDKHPANGTYEGYTAIIPSYILAANTDKANAAILSVTMVGEANPRTMAIGHDIVPDAVAGTNGVDYNLYRNTIYHILGKVSAGLELDIKVLDWDEHDLVQNVGVAWTGGNEIYISSCSPIDLRRSGLLWADDYSLNGVRVEIIDAVSPTTPRVKAEFVATSVPMEDRDDATYAGFVDHLKGFNNQDIVLTQVGGYSGWNTVAADEKVTLRIYNKLLQNGFMDVSVYLNRVQFNDRVWIDRAVGANGLLDVGTWFSYDTQLGSRIECPAGYESPDRAYMMTFNDTASQKRYCANNDTQNQSFGECVLQDRKTNGYIRFINAGITRMDNGTVIKKDEGTACFSIKQQFDAIGYYAEFFVINGTTVGRYNEGASKAGTDTAVGTGLQLRCIKKLP